MLEEIVGAFDGFALVTDKCVKFLRAHCALYCVPFFHTGSLNGLGCRPETLGNVVSIEQWGEVFELMSVFDGGG